MAEMLQIRKLHMMVYRVIRAKRNDCGMDEYFDEVVGHCSLCSEICLPQRGTMNVCALNCQSFYWRLMENQHQQQHQQQQQLPEDVAPASTFPELNIFIPVTILFSILFLVGVALSIIFIYRRRGSLCSKSPKDESAEIEIRGSARESGGNASEKERLNGELERGLPDYDRQNNFQYSPEATEALSSLCSTETNIHQLHHQHLQQNHHQEQKTETVDFRYKV